MTLVRRSQPSTSWGKWRKGQGFVVVGSCCVSSRRKCGCNREKRQVSRRCSLKCHFWCRSIHRKLWITVAGTVVAIALHQKHQGQRTRTQVLAGGWQGESKGQLGDDRTGADIHYSTSSPSWLQGWWVTTYRKHLLLMLIITDLSQMDPDQEERQQTGPGSRTFSSCLLFVLAIHSPKAWLWRLLACFRRKKARAAMTFNA